MWIKFDKKQGYIKLDHWKTFKTLTELKLGKWIHIVDLNDKFLYINGEEIKNKNIYYTII